MKILKVFPDTPMYYSHLGLFGILARSRITKINEGEFYIFINRAATAFKLLTAGNVLVYYKSPSASRPISIDAIAYIPHFFGSDKDAGYSKALEHTLRKKVPQIFREV